MPFITFSATTPVIALKFAVAAIVTGAVVGLALVGVLMLLEQVTKK